MHANAAGCSILDSSLRSFHEYANEKLKNINFNEGVYDVNFIRKADDSDISQLITELAEYPEVWGQKNPETLICVKDIHVYKSDIQIMGANKDTLKITKNGIAYMKFHAKEMIEELNNCTDIYMNIVGKPNINTWMGNTTSQIFIEDYEIIDDILSF